MLSLYVVLSIVGGGLLLISMIFGGHGHGALGPEAHAAGDSTADHGTIGPLAVLANLRFWTHFSAFFGAAGLLLSYFSDLAPILVLLLSGGMGILAGASMSALSFVLTRAQSTSAIDASHLAGRTAEVLVAIGPGKPGKVRFGTGGELLDMPAVVSGGEELPAGSMVVILGLEGDKLMVAAEPALLGATTTEGGEDV